MLILGGLLILSIRKRMVILPIVLIVAVLVAAYFLTIHVFRTRKMVDYRLGDALRLWPSLCLFYSEDSIAHEYVRKKKINLHAKIITSIFSNNTDLDYKLLADIVEDRVSRGWESELPNVACVHIGIGGELFFYRDKVLPGMPPGIDKVHIVVRRCGEREKSHAAAVEALFKEHGYETEVSLKINGGYEDADRDFVRMASSRCFVSGGGDFSNIIAGVVRAKGGLVFSAHNP